MSGMKLNKNPTIFLKNKGKQWFDDLGSSTSSKGDGNLQQEGDFTQEGEILDGGDKKPTRSKIKTIPIKDLPQLDLTLKETSPKKRKSLRSLSAGSTELQELRINKKNKDEATGAKSVHEEGTEVSDIRNEDNSESNMATTKNPQMFINNQVNTVWSPTNASDLNYKAVEEIENNRRNGRALGIKMPPFSVHFNQNLHESIFLNIQAYLRSTELQEELDALIQDQDKYLDDEDNEIKIVDILKAAYRRDTTSTIKNIGQILARVPFSVKSEQDWHTGLVPTFLGKVVEEMKNAGIRIHEASDAEMRQVMVYWKANLLDYRNTGELSEETATLLKTEVLGAPAHSWNELSVRFIDFWTGLIDLRNQASKVGLLAIKRRNAPNDKGANNFQQGRGQNPIQRGNQGTNYQQRRK
jgi:hypothetical protein